MKILITGGAGFIGSNLAEHFLRDERVELVRVIDDFSNGYRVNVEEFLQHPKYEIMEGGICYIINGSTINLIDLIACIEESKGNELNNEFVNAQPEDVTVTFADTSKAQNEIQYEPKANVKEGVSRFINLVKAY